MLVKASAQVSIPVADRWCHNPYCNAGLFPVFHFPLLRKVPLRHWSHVPAWQRPTHRPRGPVIYAICGGVSHFTEGEDIAALVEFHTGVRVWNTSVTQGKFVVQVRDMDLPKKVCRHGAWRTVRQGHELMIDRPEFAKMTAATLKGFVEEKLEQRFPFDKIVKKKPRMVYIEVEACNWDSLLTLNNRVLLERDGHYFFAQSSEESQELAQYVDLMPQSDEVRNACLPQHLLRIEFANHPPRH